MAAPDQTAPRKPLLDLNTFSDRKAVLIDGNRYEVLNGDEFDVVSIAKITRLGMEMATLEVAHDFERAGLRKFSDADAKEYGRLVDETSRLVLKAPPEVHDRLKFSQRHAIVQVFIGRTPQTSAPAAETQTTAGTSETTIPETGETSSPDSSGSTAAAPENG